jgi:hypothetical protein
MSFWNGFQASYDKIITSCISKFFVVLFIMLILFNNDIMLELTNGCTRDHVVYWMLIYLLQ